MRLALHAGPVYLYTNPITRQSEALGTHMLRAARIEPITPTGSVYASLEFAAQAEVEGVQGFLCHYVGQTPLAKGYGEMPIYRVIRSV
jgi:hypothetical protein